MDYFEWKPRKQVLRKEISESGMWIDGRTYVDEAYFQLSASDRDLFLDFYASHVYETFVYFTGVDEGLSLQQFVYSKNTAVVCAVLEDSITLWATDIVEQSVDSGQDSVFIDQTIPLEGTLHICCEYVGDGNYLFISLPDDSYVKVYIDGNRIISEAGRPNLVSVVSVEGLSIWHSPNLIMGDVISFTVSWDNQHIVFTHNGQTEFHKFGFSLAGATVNVLQNTYDVILIPAFLSKCVKFFNLDFTDDVNITVSDYQVQVDKDCFLYVYGDLGIPVNVTKPYVRFFDIGSGLFESSNVQLWEV